MIEYLASCASVPAATDLASYINRHRARIIVDIAASTVCWEFISPIWSDFANAVSRAKFLETLQKFRDAFKRLEDLGKSAVALGGDENENTDEIVSQDDVIAILRPENPGKFQKAVDRAHSLILDGEMKHFVFEEQLRVSAMALIEKILDHQNAKKPFETPYKNDVVLHTNVPVESFFGTFDNLDIRFRNMAKTTVCQTAVAHFNKTDSFVHKMESIEVNRILASRRHSRQNERMEEAFQRDERHRAKLARHENVNKIPMISQNSSHITPTILNYLLIGSSQVVQNRPGYGFTLFGR